VIVPVKLIVPGQLPVYGLGLAATVGVIAQATCRDTQIMTINEANVNTSFADIFIAFS